MAWIGAAITAGAAIYGDITSSNSAAGANQMNYVINQQNLRAQEKQFNSAQAFNQQQMKAGYQYSSDMQQHGFQDTMALQKESENYDERMSDTAVSRRMADLKRAGVNPLMAMGPMGAASAPTVASGTIGGGSIGGSGSPGPVSPGSANQQNAGAAWGNLGNQVGSALQLQTLEAQKKLLEANATAANASADKTQLETSTKIPAEVDYIKSATGINTEQAQVVHNNIEYVATQIMQGREQAALTNIQAKLQSQNSQILNATRDSLISAATSDAAARALGLAAMRNQSDLQSSSLGKVLTIINAILTPAGSAVKIGAGIGAIP